MKNNCRVRNRRSREDEKSYLFTARLDLWKDIEETAYALDISIAHLIRESLRRNIAEYKRARS